MLDRIVPNRAYMSNNPVFPQQVFYVHSINHRKQFSKENAVVVYDRYAFSKSQNQWYKVERNTSWALQMDRNREMFSIFGDEVPLKFMSELPA